jgi:hypothetical protein
MKNRRKKNKIWLIKNQDNDGYWQDIQPDFTYDFEGMNDGDKFTIECKELTTKEYNALVKNSSEFDGW